MPSELQTAGRWLYWSCGQEGLAGAYDLTANTRVTLPDGRASLGDGYLVRHVGDKLVLNDFRAPSDDRPIADLPPGSSPQDDRGWHWTVDRFGGGVAWLDETDTIHVLHTAIPSSPLEEIGYSDMTDVRPGQNLPLTMGWKLSKPVSSWKLEVVNPATRQTVATVSGAANQSYPLDITWDGRTGTGAAVPNGSYDGVLKAIPADGVGGELVRHGTVSVLYGLPVAHDYNGDGPPDLFGRTSSAATVIRMNRGAAGGQYGQTTDSSGWPTNSLVIPAGDLNGDSVNDLLVRTSTGELRRYDGGSGGRGPNPTAGYQALTGGWQAYNTILAVGDLNGDGRFDILGRDATGVMWRHEGDGKGGFLKARVKLTTGWQTYNWIGTPGDLTGDGIPELLGRDATGAMWRHDGNGKGGFLAARTKLTTGWQTYNTIVGVGDLNGDGKNDLVGRDSSGFLWRHDGTGQGGFRGARTKIGTGWGTYRTLF